MVFQVDFVPFATGGGAAVMTQANYLAAAPNGVVAGLADPTFANKSWRQAAMMSSALANFVSTKLQTNVIDDGNLNALTALLASAFGPRICLGANTTFFVNATSGSDANNGLTSGTAWATRNHAYNYVQANYDLCGFVVTFNCVGNFSDAFTAVGPLVGQNGAASCVWLGNSGAPGTVVVSSAATCFLASQGAKFMVNGFQLASSAGYALLAQDTGSIIQYLNVNFAACSLGHCGALFTAGIYPVGNEAIVGNAPTHWFTSFGGTVGLQTSIVVTLTGTPAFSVGFAEATNTSSISIPSGSCTFSGAGSGPRYLASLGGAINTQGGGANFFPGSSAGTSPTGYYA